jgi:hypothetical protein
MCSPSIPQHTQPQPFSSVSKGGCASTVVEGKGPRSTQFGRYCVFFATSTAWCDTRQIGDKLDSLRMSDVDGTVK